MGVSPWLGGAAISPHGSPWGCGGAVVFLPVWPLPQEKAALWPPKSESSSAEDMPSTMAKLWGQRWVAIPHA